MEAPTIIVLMYLIRIKALEKNQNCCENISQWAHVSREMMEGDVVGLW